MKKRIKILYINPNADLYGASRVLLRLIISFDRNIYIPVVVLPEEGPLAIALRRQQISVYVIPYLSVIRRNIFNSWRIIPFALFIIPSIITLTWLIHKEQIDLVHTNTGVVFPPTIAAWLCGKPHIWHLHEIFADEFPGMWRYYQALILGGSEKVLCVSSSVARQFPSLCNKVEIVHNGLDIAEFLPRQNDVLQWRKKFCSQLNIKLVGVVGRISPRKGLTLFLEAASLLKAQGYKNIRYLVVGDVFAGNEYFLQELKLTVQEHGLQDDIIFVGFMENPVPLIAALDILVLPSILPEAFPTVVLEAMALNVPVVATSIGGTVEQIEHMTTGLLVPPKKPDAIAEAIITLLSDPDLMCRMGQLASRKVEESFTQEKMTNLIESIYEKVVRDMN